MAYCNSFREKNQLQDDDYEEYSGTDTVLMTKSSYG